MQVVKKLAKVLQRNWKNCKLLKRNGTMNIWHHQKMVREFKMEMFRDHTHLQIITHFPLLFSFIFSNSHAV